ncbi:polymorphic toxin type 17 domain-containing protein [Streptomyces sp. NBC_01210]|uniref:polymorphic toxin type 17 domain-containing protein n=1 Tax=Streptomyces sp. NBC_01210 TaxID=2903774 RepID=UPI002E139E9A|nr:polymorphic toxin type 17 domain-containing protein [Streptomyces sp. NBC_01210]
MSVEDEAKEILLKLGMWWPDADSGTLRKAADAWRAFAGAVDDVRTPVNNAAASLIHNNKGEAIDAFEVFWERYAKGKDAGWLSDMAKAARKMAEMLDKLAGAVDDAINKLQTELAIDATIIVAGLGLAWFTAGISAGASAIAAEAILELAGTLGVAVTTTVAEIAAGAVVAAAFGGVESVAIDLAVAQPMKKATGLQKGFSLDEINAAAKDGMIYGGAFGGASGLAKAGAEGSLFGKFNETPLMLRPPTLRPDLVELGPAARPAKKTPCVGEPIDVATGAMLMTQTDLTLPASLPLAFERTHLSTYRAGMSFGPTWVSTLDECIQLDAEGVVFAAADGMRLVYPVPQVSEPVLPVKGALWPLEWDGKPDGVMTITDPVSGVVRSFSSPVPSDTLGTVHLPVDSWHDRNGARIDVERTADGIPTALRHSGGYYLAVDTQGPRITALRLLDETPSRYEPTQHNGGGTVVMRYGYDEAGNLTEVINSSGEPLRFTYDAEGRVASWTDRNGTSFAYFYDARGRVERTEGSDGFLSGALAYDDESRTTTYTDSLGRRSKHRYNSEGQVVEETDPLGHTTRTEWHERGDRPLSVTDPLGRTTRYAYDETGNLIALNLPDGSAIRAAYNRLSQPVEVVESGGATWRHTYDEQGNLLTTTDPLGAETRYGYDELGHLSAVTDALGHRREITLNAAGLGVTVIDELGHTTVARRDAFGRIVEVIDPLGRATRMGWTTEGKPDWRAYADGTREAWTWDGEGNLLTHTDPAGNVTRHSVTHFDMPATRTEPDGTAYSFAYDTELRLTKVTNPQGLTWLYEYDEAGRLIAETDFDGRTLGYAHDATGDLASRTNGAGETLRFTRDAVGRLTEQRTDTGDTTTYTYGASGHLIHTANSHAVVAIERDALAHILAETVNGRTTTYTYDVLGRRIRRTTPSALSSQWTYDQAGRATELGSDAGVLTFAYDAAGRETERRLGYGVTLDQTWDEADRLTTQSLTRAHRSEADRLVQHRTYAYREDGYLTEIRELTSGTRRFDLDRVGRVTGVQAHGWTETYAYDTAGNLTHATAPAHESSGDRAFDGTLIRRAGRTLYEHDAQGRLVRKTRKLLNGQQRTWTYAWNAEDRLVEVVTPDGERWRYMYDPLGRRISKQCLADDGSVAECTDFTWDDTRLAEQKGPDDKVTTWDYAPGTHRPLTQTDHRPMFRKAGESLLSALAGDAGSTYGTRFHAVVADTVGTPTELVSMEGDVTWQRRTTLWGTRFPAGTDAASSVDCPLRFPGQYHDLESGLNYNYFRYYDSEIARYVSPDPLGLDPAPDPYAYVGAPLTWVDPLGLKCEEPVPKPRTGVKGLLKDAQLPHSGRIRFVPPDNTSLNSGLLRGPRKGYIDRFGNEWIKGPSRTAGQPFEWDVQLSKTGRAKLGWLSRDGSHLNVSLDGEITHK